MVSTGLIVAGWDETDGGAIYEIPLGGACVKQPFSIGKLSLKAQLPPIAAIIYRAAFIFLGGSGSTYIYGYVDSVYRPGMSAEEAKVLVRTAISHAMARDGSSGELLPLSPTSVMVLA